MQDKILQHKEGQHHSGPVDRPWQVLLIDDDEVIRHTLESYLVFHGHCDVFHAANAFDGLSILEQNQDVDIAFVDINLPGMDGIEFVKRLKKRDSTVVAAIITGEPSMDVIVQAMRSGASDFLIKPFRLEQFQVSMERMVKERSILLENQFLSEEIRIKKALERMNKKLEKQIRNQRVLYSISEAMAKIRSTSELYNKLVALAVRLLESSRSMLWIKDQEKHQLVLAAFRGPVEMLPPRIDLDTSRHPCAMVITDGLPVILDGSSRDSNGAKAADVVPDDCFIAVPFKVRGEILGVLAASGPILERFKGEEALFLLNILAERASLTIENLLLYDSLLINLHDTLQALVRSLEAKDPYTRQHSERVTRMSLGIAKEMGCTQEQLDTLAFAAPLHDIGKIGIKDYVLTKKAALTDEEYELIKKHPVIGAEIVGHLGLLDEETSIVRHHHERWDGRGYPDGLAGREIPRLSRIVAVADAFDAITSCRSYRAACGLDFAKKEILDNSGTQFDPEVVEAFISYLQRRNQKKEAGLVTDHG